MANTDLLKKMLSDFDSGSKISNVQRQAQNTSPAMPLGRSVSPPQYTASPYTGGTPTITNLPYSGGTPTPAPASTGASVSNYGDGEVVYNSYTGGYSRIMPDGREYYVAPGDAKYNSIASEYKDRGTPPNPNPPAPPPPSGTWSGQGATTSHPDQGTLHFEPISGRITRTMPDGRQYYVETTDEKYQSIYNEYMIGRYGAMPPPIRSQGSGSSGGSGGGYPGGGGAPGSTMSEIAELKGLVDELRNMQYQPVDVEGRLSNTMTYAQAYDLANGIISPQYQQSYENTANASAQRLDRQGLHDSLYGQALAAEAERDITKDKNAAIGNLALNLQEMDYDKAVRLANLLASENQFGANYKLNSLNSAAQTGLGIVDAILTQARDANNYKLEAAALKIKGEASAVDNLYKMGQINQQQYENRLYELEIEAQEAALAGGVNSSNNNWSPSPPEDDPPTYSELEAMLYAGTIGQDDYTRAVSLGVTSKTWDEYRENDFFEGQIINRGNNGLPPSQFNALVSGWLSTSDYALMSQELRQYADQMSEEQYAFALNIMESKAR